MIAKTTSPLILNANIVQHAHGCSCKCGSHVKAPLLVVSRATEQIVSPEFYVRPEKYGWWKKKKYAIGINRKIRHQSTPVLPSPEEKRCPTFFTENPSTHTEEWHLPRFRWDPFYATCPNKVARKCAKRVRGNISFAISTRQDPRCTDANRKRKRERVDIIIIPQKSPKM